MGIVLSFTPQSAAMKKPSRGCGTAAVVIFPGVRYEREQAGAAAPQGKTPLLPVELPPAPKH
ncbi:hypothetical protein ABID44_002987 [Aquamicrobium ahrensii]|uniref:Propionyl-coenzyme A carboxylase alpha polypeptide n=1 Tax=Aquamicrobium ahrensii TaxID=469551 RepID=A0ABV2KNI4_9HYPH